MKIHGNSFSCYQDILLTRLNCRTYQRAITQEKFRIYLKKQSSPISILSFNITAQIIFVISCLQDFIALCFQRGITQERGLIIRINMVQKSMYEISNT